MHVPKADPPAKSDAPEDRALDRWLSPYFTDSTLFPVVLVAAAVGVTLGSTLLLLAVVERNFFAAAALFVLAGVSVDVVYRDLKRRRFGLLSRIVAGFWALSTLGAAAAIRWGVF